MKKMYKYFCTECKCEVNPEELIETKPQQWTWACPYCGDTDLVESLDERSMVVALKAHAGLIPGVQVAKIRFDPRGKEYHFYSNIEMHQGDDVLVETQHGKVPATFVGYTKDTSKAYRWVLENLTERKRKQEDIEKRLMRIEIVAKERVKNMPIEKLLAALAPHDALVKGMEEEYHWLKGEERNA